ncbi:hypothetical protein, partial [Streptomyces sp. t39]|uniref:hypothetical protein n=1 Tax=Streptomyces sp. t39 TaxID=1828156 RepID=UPI0011CDBCE2
MPRPATTLPEGASWQGCPGPAPPDGSAGVFPSAVVTPLDGIRARLRGRARVLHVPGPSAGAPPEPLDTALCRD